MHTAKILGGGITKKVDDRVVMFYDTGSTYMLHTEAEGYAVPYPGRYRVTMDAQGRTRPQTPVVLTLYQGVKQGNRRIPRRPDRGPSTSWTTRRETVEVTTFMRPGDLLAPSVAELDRPPRRPTSNHFAPDKTVAKLQGARALRSSPLTVEGPR